MNDEAAEPEQEQTEGRDRERVTLSEAIVPVAGIAFSIYYLTTIWNLPFEARMSGFIISALIFTLTAILAARWITQAVQHGVDSGVWTLLGETNAAIAKRLSVLALTIAYVLLLPHLGFFVATLAFLMAAFAILGVRKPLHLALVPLIATSVGHLLFILVMGISLPTGVVGAFLESIKQAAGF